MTKKKIITPKATSTKSNTSKIEKMPYDTPEETGFQKYFNMLIWVFLAVGLIHQIGLLDEISEAFVGYLAQCFLMGTGAFLACFFHITLVLPFQLGRQVQLNKWREECRGTIRLGTIGIFLSIVSTILMLWPTYHVATFGLIFILGMGFVNLLSLIAELIIYIQETYFFVKKEE